MARRSMVEGVARHQNSLADDIVSTGVLRTKSKKRKAHQNEDGQEYIDSRASRKILRIGQELAAEEEEELKNSGTNPAFDFASRFQEDSGTEEDANYDDDDNWVDEQEEEVTEDIDPEDLDVFNKFMPQSGEEPTLDLSKKEPEQRDGTYLADLILKQIAAHESTEAGQPMLGGDGEAAAEEDAEMSEKVVQAYSTIGQILSRYKSGKLPKPFKVLPTVPHWEEVIEMTRPESWTPNACYEATRIFISSNAQVAQRFLEMVILDRVREDIYENKKLNVHLFNALKKATYKPAAFFKGVLFPLVESGTCTLREAHIISGVLVRCSIPPLHAAAALMRLTDIAAEQASQSTEGGGATNIFIRALLDKRYALPYKVIDNLVFHFLRFRAPNPNDAETMGGMDGPGAYQGKLPVLWHQSLLSFAQRYRNDITEDQRESLLDLLLVKGHKDIGPEVRKELLAGRGRGVPVPEKSALDGGDDTMVVDPV